MKASTSAYIHEGREFRHLRTQLIGDLAPLLAGGLGFVLNKGGADEGSDDTTALANEGEMIEPQVDEVQATTGIATRTVTADAGYSYGKVYGALEQRGIVALIPAKAEPIRSRVPLRRFRYDAKHDLSKCQTGRILRTARPIKHGRFFY
jgi:hypothetical protein